MKLAADDLHGVAETLLIPLAYRDDSFARAFRDRIDYDWQKFAGGGLQRVGIVARARFVREYPLSDAFPEIVPPQLTADELRRAAKIVQARFVSANG